MLEIAGFSPDKLLSNGLRKCPPLFEQLGPEAVYQLETKLRSY